MHNRPIVNTRDEPHADANKYRRLHGIVGDANMSEYSTALKLGTTALVISLIEQRRISDSFAIDDPIQTIKEVSRDQTFEWKLRLRDGATISAIDLQRKYLDLARQHFAGQDSETDWVITEWELVLDRLERDPMSLMDSLDWVAKKWLLETFIDEEGISWDDPWLQSLDLEYHNINQDEGLYYGLQAQGLMRRVVTDRQIEHAIHHPPQDTRAYFRGQSLNKFSADVQSVQWDNITFNLKGKPVSVCMKQLADPSLAAEYNRVLNESPTVESLIENLRIQN